MGTLTETAFYSRKIVKWGIVGIIAFLILRMLFNVAVDAFRQAFPAPPLRPNNLFGKIPAPTFPQGATESAQLEYTLQTITGAVPIASDAARVYFMPKNRVNLLSLSKAQTFVGRLGFTSSPRELTETSYRWIDLKSPLRTIEMDIVSNHFVLSYSYIHDLALFAERNIPNATTAVTESLAFLQSLGLNLTDISSSNTKITYLKITGDKLEPTTSQSQADAVRVDFFRKSFDGLAVVNDIPGEGNIYFILSGSRRTDRRILRAEFAYWPIDLRSFAAYRLKTGEQAFAELKEGKAYFAFLPSSQTQIKITNVYLADYDSKLPQLYLQPVFVFEGENGFLAYVAAVAPPWSE